MISGRLSSERQSCCINLLSVSAHRLMSSGTTSIRKEQCRGEELVVVVGDG